MIESTVKVSMSDDNDLNCSYAIISKGNTNVIIILKDSECAIFDYNCLKADNFVYEYLLLKHYDNKENFCTGNRNGIFEINGIRIGIRICFEVRFPEYFRELYMEKTELNLILFYDVSDYDDVERYELIKSHIRTRAVENVCDILTVNTIHPFQTAPTAFFDKSGHVVDELERNTEGMLVFDFEKKSLNFGEKGRKEISEILTARI